MSQGYLERADWDREVGPFFRYHRLDVGKVTPSGYRVEGQTLSWNLAPFTPTENLVVQAVSYTSLECSSVLDESLAYGPQQAYDGRLETAWVPQGGTGGWIFIPTCYPEDLERHEERSPSDGQPRPLKGLRIFAGYGKSRDLFQARPEFTLESESFDQL